jgi:DNA-binding response OmpR family regulator/anti-sigma regulatory factor (Ser/Thr protein kinase)
LEAGRVSATYQPTDLAALTIDLTSVFRAAADSAGIQLRVACPALDEPVYVDREMWEQIVTNLCANALKFTNAGSITVTLSRDAAAARLEVADTGIGIAIDDLPLIFDRFRRGEAPQAAARVGSGLGLALVRELVDLHSGHIDVHSTPGTGSTFVVTIPFGTAHLEQRQIAAAHAIPPRALSLSSGEVLDGIDERPPDADASVRAATPPSDIASSCRLPGVSIWVLDDNVDMRRYLSNLVTPHWTVVTFPTAERVLEALSVTVPDLILSDVTLPGMSGLDLLAALRARPATAHVPVLLLSARAGEEATLEGLHAGADDYLVKPFTARELLSRIRSNLHLSGVRREAATSALRHAARIEALAAAATRIISAEKSAAIATAVTEFAHDVPSVASCDVTLARDLPAPQVRETAVAGAVSGGIRIALTADDGSTLGTIDLTVDDGDTLDDEDRQLVEQLAVVASRRMEHLLRYRRERDISHTLQRSLLPQSLPHLAPIEIVARYRAAIAADDVGGDWYDDSSYPMGASWSRSAMSWATTSPPQSP